MGNKKKVALVYSLKDDQPIGGATKGWVSNFHRFFATLLYQITREKADIQLVNEVNFNSVDLSNYNAILAIVTENLTENKDIVNELNNLGKELKAKGKLITDGMPRFFKILKEPYDSDELLNEYKDLLTYDFYLVDSLTGNSQEITRFLGEDAERSYWMKLVDIAYDTNHILHFKERERGSISYENIPRENTVYLASTGVDIVIQRDIVKRELIRHGFKVLPDHSLPKEYRALDLMVREDLNRCRLSIHMVGEEYGYKPQGSELSVVDIQNRIASDHTHQMVKKNKALKGEEKKPFSRLIWISPDLKNVTERQKTFIEDLKSDAATLEEAEVLQIQLQELKAIIREELVTGGRFNTKQDFKKFNYDMRAEFSKMIYLIADKQDINQVNDLQKYLKQKGYNVVSSSYEGDLVDLRYLHQENLRRCDASLIYFGGATEDWIKTKLQDLLKAPGFGRQKPIEVKAVYFEGEKEVDLALYEKNNTLVLGNNGDSFSPNHLTPFLTKIES